MRPEDSESARLSAQLREAAKGNSAALAYLYDEYGEAVYRVALRITQSFADAEDVVQDVFVGLPEALRNYEHRGKFLAWLIKVTERTAELQLRRQAMGREAPARALRYLVRRRTAPADAIDRLALERAVAALPETQRIVFVLRTMEGFTHQEIGELLGITWTASGQRFCRAIRMLRALLTEDA